MDGSSTLAVGRLRGRQYHSDYTSSHYYTKPVPPPVYESSCNCCSGSPTRMAFHLEIDVWLQTLELEEYIPLFKTFFNVKDLLHWTEKNLLDLGIKDAAHRARLISNLVYIREKLKRTSISGGLPPLTTTPPRSPRSSVSVSPTPASPSRLHFRYSAIPEDHLTKTPPQSPGKIKMSILDMSPDDLRKQLEEELKLPSEDLRSHAWFHGGISREKAERLIRENGDFLVRDSISKPGNFVLTVRWKSVSMHFVVNKVLHKAHSPYANVQYQFEKECFDNIPSLIRFYVGNCKPVSQVSGAVIQRPINRTLPLSYTDNKYAATNKSHSGAYIYGHLQKKVVTPRRGSMNGGEGIRQRSGSNPSSLLVNGGVEKSPVNRTDSYPLLDRTSATERAMSPATLVREHASYRRTGSEPILSPSRENGPIESDYAETRPCLNISTSDEEGNMSAASTDNSPTAPLPLSIPTITNTPPPTEESSEAASSPTEDVPDSPSPAEDVKEVDSVDGVDGEGDGGDAKTSEPSEPETQDHIYSEVDHLKGVEGSIPVRYTMLHDEDSSPVPPIIQDSLKEQELSEQTDKLQDLDVKPRKKVVSGTRFSVLESDYSRVGQRSSPNHLEKKADIVQRVLPIRETESIFRPQELCSSLLDKENKPLDKVAMDTIRQMLLQSNPLALARHLTLADTEVCRIGHGSNNNSMPGLELLCLPHGTRFRQDILERHNCLRMFCMATLLTCDDLEIRVQILHQWIQLAETLRGSLGNLYSFATIMDALATKQVCYLRGTWDQLRSRFTNMAVNYDTKLRSLLKSLNAGDNVVPLTKTSLPHILPIIRLMERDWSDALDRDWSRGVATKDVLDAVPSGEPWEVAAPSYGMDVVLSHLQNAHSLAQQTNLYRINAHAKLAKHPPEDVLLEAFGTDLHLRLLWGSKVTTDNVTERYRLLEQVLSIMAQKMEFAGNSV